ncbi:catenin beta 1 [Schistosoma bovis]|uniref:Catenin beta 1 n=1 Tax=Schistosoma bovis TaxID=6184 RepID=A0A430QA57_SCHBO|nr:catenin beta 1 [Schistosoma bovis]
MLKLSTEFLSNLGQIISSLELCFLSSRLRFSRFYSLYKISAFKELKMRKHSHVYDSQNSKEFQHSVSVNSSKSDSSAPIFHECFSSVEKLSGPVSKLNEIIQDLIDYKNDAEFAAMTASDLAKRLRSNISADEAFQVVSYIHKFARYQAARCGLVNCSELVRAIIHILQTTKNVDLQSEAALTLQLHPCEVMYTTALYVLNQLLWHLPNYSRPEFRQCNGQLNLIYLLEANRLDDSNWLLICLDTLRMAVYESSETKALTPLLNCTNEILQLETLWGLRNISDQAYHLLATKNLIPILINLLASGVKVLCRLLCLNSDRQEIAEPICSALRHVTHRNPHSNSAIYEVRTSDTLSTIASLFLKYQFVSALPLLKSVVGLIRNLSTVEVTRHELKQQYHGITEEESNNYLEGVNLEDMLELTLAALQIMAKDQSIQEEFIHTAGLVSSVVQLVYSPSVCLQRASTAFLSQLSTSRSGCQAIENEGASILHRIAQDKPEAYRRRLSLELRQSLFDGGLLNDPNEIDPYNSSPSKLIDGIPPNDNSPHITDRRSRNLSDSSLRQRSK